MVTFLCSLLLACSDILLAINHT